MYDALLASGQSTITVASFDERAIRTLTAGERREYDEIESDTRQRDWLAGRCAAKHAVAEAADVTPGDVQLVARRRAAPRAMLRRTSDTWTPAPFAVTIAHRDGWAVASASPFGVRIGVDVERAGAVAPGAERFFISRVESKAAELFGPSAFWALKEAAWKAFGLGDTQAFADLQLCVDRAGELRAACVCGVWNPVRAGTWSLPNNLIAAAVRAEQVVQ